MPAVGCGDANPAARDAGPSTDARPAPEAGAPPEDDGSTAPDGPPEDDASAPVDATVAPDSVAAGLAALGAAPCVDNPEFLCARLEVPVNHEGPADGTLSIAVAVRPASGGAWSGRGLGCTTS